MWRLVVLIEEHMEMIFEDRIRNMSDGDFAHFGAGNLAYIKPENIDGMPCFILSSAVGEEIVVTANYGSALAAVADFRRGLQAWWTQGWDLLLTPTLSEPPVKIGEHDATDDDPMAGMKRAGRFVTFTPPFNASGQPAISLPLHWNDDGLPIGIQLVAAYGREDLLLAVASQLECAHPWADRRPPVPPGI